MPSSLVTLDQTSDVNCGPRSLVTVVGTPNRAIQPDMNARARETAEVSEMGMASGHLVNLSMMVKRYVNPWEGGRGPTKST